MPAYRPLLRILPWSVLILSATFVWGQQGATPPDSVVSSGLQTNGTLSAAYSTNQNWSGQDFQNLTYAASLFIQHDLQRSGGRQHQHRIMADLSMVKFVDSTWSKGADFLSASLLWSKAERKWTHSYSVQFATQFLPDVTYEYNTGSDLLEERNVGGFGAPSTLELGYGATWLPWPRSSIQFAFATLKLSASPKYYTTLGNAGVLAETDQNTYSVQYGASMIANINRKLSPRLDWINSTRLFVNGLSADQLSLNMRNRVIVKIWKFVQLRLDTRLVYDPRRSYDLGFSQEVLLGVFYEHFRSK